MNLLISVSVSLGRQYLEKYFDANAIQKAYNQNDLSRETVVTLKCLDFLQLASPGIDMHKEEAVANILHNNRKFSSLPYLGVKTRRDGNIEVIGNGGDHDGRHRVRALLNLGVTELPICIISHQTKDGDCFRWGSTSRRPEYLYGYNWFKVPFPEIET